MRARADLRAARRRAACAASSSTASRRRCSSSARCSSPPVDFVAIAVIFANVPQLGGWTRAGGRAPVRARDDLVRAHRPRDRPPRPAPADDPRGHVRPDPRPPAAVALPAGRGGLRGAAARARRFRGSPCSCTRSSRSTSTGRSDACSRSRSRSPPARVIYGAVWVALATIAFWIVDAIEFVNAFTYGGSFLSQYPIGIFGRWLRGSRRLPHPRRVRRVLPGALRARQGGRARPARGAAVRVAVRRRARGPRSRRRSGGTPCATTGAPVAEPVIEVDGCREAFVIRAKAGRLRRERRVVDAVDGISFAIERGAMVGYLGPNGAGKSTTVKMLTGHPRPERGAVRVAGLDPSRQRIELARRIGVVFGQRTQLWWDLPLDRSLRPPAPHLPRARASGFAANLDRFARRARARPLPGDARAPALARPAHARRADGRAPARPGDPLPGRADHRAGRGRQGSASASSSPRSTASAGSRCC